MHVRAPRFDNAIWACVFAFDAHFSAFRALALAARERIKNMRIFRAFQFVECEDGRRLREEEESAFFECSISFFIFILFEFVHLDFFSSTFLTPQCSLSRHSSPPCAISASSRRPFKNWNHFFLVISGGKCEDVQSINEAMKAFTTKHVCSTER